MTLECTIENWDGKSTEQLDRAYQVLSKDEDFLEHLIHLANKSDCEVAATWLLKRWLENGNSISALQSERLIYLLSNPRDWQTKLHILQSLSYLSFTDAIEPALYLFLKSHLDNENKFVRAWVYNGFYLLAEHFHQYREETIEYFEMAMRDESPSVKARIRNIRKAVLWM